LNKKKWENKIVVVNLARAESSGSVICTDERFCGGGGNWEKVRGKIGNHDFCLFMEKWRRTSP
jgi:hypothetical protein